MDIIDGELISLNSLRIYLIRLVLCYLNGFTDMIMRSVYGKVTTTNGDRKLDYGYGLYKEGFY